MKAPTTSNLKIKFLGITPVLKEEIGFFNSQEIVSFSALLTFKGKPIKELIQETLDKGENVEERMKKILRKSALKGHASLSTTPVISFLYEGSKFLDSMLTGIYFGSFLVSSGRRTDTSIEDIVYPEGILKDKKTEEIFRLTSEKIINFYNSLLEKGVKKDIASKILQYGIYGTGIIQLPLESIIAFKREYEAEKEWMPDEAGLLIKTIEEKLKEMGIDILYSSRFVAPRNTYPYPNIFKDPEESNLTRELMKEKKSCLGVKIFSADFKITADLKERLEKLQKEIIEMVKDKKRIKEDWQGILLKRGQILRDHNLALGLEVLSSVPWRVWGEKKRHRTCHQIIESIYYCIDRAGKKFKEFEKEIEEGNVDNKIVGEIEEIFSIPSQIKENKEMIDGYLKSGLSAFKSYRELIDLGIKAREAIFVIPRAVKIDILQSYDLYNLLTGYYPLRLCQTAEEEMKRNTQEEVSQIKKLFEEKGVGWLNKFILPKCELVGFCLEEKSCGQIKDLVKDYDDEFHQEMKGDLENKFKEVLK